MAQQHIAYQHRPLSQILAPQTGSKDVKAPTKETPRNDKGQFVAADDTALPEKYRGKTAQEIADMHMNSEKRLGQIQNELGEMRGLVTDLAQVQRPTNPEPKVEELNVSGDDLIQHPVETIRKVVQQDLAAIRADANKGKLDSQVERETNALLTEFGDIGAITSSEDFQKFASRTSSRQHDLNTAATGEGVAQVRAAKRLLEDYQDFKKELNPDSDKPSPVEQARNVANEGSGPSGSIAGKDLMYESEIVTLIQSDPAKYRSPSFQAGLMAAIKEGRYVKS